jgi:hypothetical protein
MLPSSSVIPSHIYHARARFFSPYIVSVLLDHVLVLFLLLYTVHHGRDSETSQVAYVTFKEFHGADTALLLSVRARTHPLAAAASLANISEHFFLLFLLSVNRRRFSIQKLQS